MIKMIKLKERYDDYRLFDTETGEYVKNTAKTRSEALFCVLLQNEIDKADTNPNNLHDVRTIGIALENSLCPPAPAQKNDIEEINTFLFFANSYLDLNAKYFEDKRFLRLALDVIKDQKEEKTETSPDYISKLVNKYKDVNNEIYKHCEIYKNGYPNNDDEEMEW